MDSIVVANVERSLSTNTIYFCILNESILSFITRYVFQHFLDFLVTSLLR